MPVISEPTNTPGLVDALAAAGISVGMAPDGWHVSDATAAQTVISGYSGSAAELAWWKAQQSAAVNAHYAAVIDAGFTFDGVLIAIDGESQRQLTAMAAIASNTIASLVATPWPSSFAWLPQGTGAPLPLPTPQAMVTFAAAVGHYVSAVILYQDTLLTQITAATTTAVVQAINPTAGWPSA